MIKAIEYTKLKNILLAPNAYDLSEVKMIEQSIPSKYYTSGLRRVCYFYNAHILEEQIKNSLLGKELIAEQALNDLHHEYSNYYYTDFPTKESLEKDIYMVYYDGTHNDFHGGEGTNDPDLRICIPVYSGQYGIDEMNDDYDMEVSWEFMEDITFSGEVKIVYNKDKNIIDTNLHHADIIYELRHGTNTVNIYRRTGTHRDELTYLGNVEIDTSGLFDPLDYPDSWN